MYSDTFLKKKEVKNNRWFLAVDGYITPFLLFCTHGKT
jgi:hypothetical protein